MNILGVIFLFWVLLSGSASAQLLDNFTDGDFTNNPVWTGDIAKFEIDGDSKLHLNAPAVSDEAYLSTPSQAIEDAVWEFYVEIGENPSGSNFTQIYLVADKSDLSGTFNGYFIKAGGSADEVSLYRQDGNATSEIIDGLDDRVDMKPVTLRVKVTRDIMGNWELFTDNTGGTAYVAEGSVFDDTYVKSSYFGVYCKYSSTRSDKFYFDDFNVTGNPFTDDIPPEVLSLEVVANDSLQIQFSEALETGSAENTANYQVEGNSPNAAVWKDSHKVLLTFSTPFDNGATYTLTISNVADTSGNTMLPVDMEFTYFEPVPAVFRDIVINEIFPDPNPQVDSLPTESDAEFIELFNNSEHPFDLENWSINGELLPAYLLLPGQYVILSKETYALAYAMYGKVLGLNNWPALSNSGTAILLKDAGGMLVDSLAYSGSQITGGYSLEQINPNPPCLTADNFLISTHANGATPGSQNAVFDNTPDMVSPNLLNLSVDSANRVSLFFDERLDEISGNNLENYSISGGMEVVGVEAVDEQAKLITSRDWKQGETYTVTVGNVTDCSGNVVTANTLSFHYDVQPPAISKIMVLDTSTVEVTWDETTTKSSAEKEENYTVDNENPVSAKMLDEDPLRVQLVFEQAFGEGILYTLFASQIADTLGNAIPDAAPASFSFTYLNQIDSVLVIDGNLLEVYFAEAVNEEIAENTENYEVDRNIGQPGVAILAEDKRSVTLIFGAAFSENKEHDLTIRNLTIFTPIQRFFYDTKAPKITEISVQSSNTLLVSFDEAIRRNSAEDVENYEVEGMGKPIAAEWQPNGLSVLLRFPTDFTEEVEHKLSVNDIADLAGNENTRTQTGTFIYDPLPPAIQQLVIVSSQQISLIFSEPLDAVTAANINYYQINQNAGFPDSVIVDKANSAKVDLIFNSKLDDTLKYTLTVQGIKDLHGNGIVNPVLVGFSNQFPSLAGVFSLSEKEVRVRFSKPLSKEVAEKPENYLLETAAMPTKASLNIENSTEVTLTFARSFVKKKEYEISITHIEDVEGNKADTLKALFSYDPKIVSILKTGKSVLQVEFAVPLAMATANNTLNFSLDQGFGNPKAAVLNENTLKELTLYFEKEFASSTAYHLSVANLKDALEQMIPASVNFFGTGAKPGFNELIITEIMADPTPVVGLPEADYLEIYNPSTKVLSLQGIQLSDAISTTTLPEVLLKPNEYAILCATADVDEFEVFGKAVRISSFPSLNNAEDEISLHDENGQLIFHIHYMDDWYKDSQKAEGGWSLEMVDTSRPCGGIENWTASENVIGGTPGGENSVNTSNPDRTGPHLLSAWAAADTLIQLNFNENINPMDISDGNFEVMPTITIDSIIPAENLREVTLQMKESLKPKTVYTIQVESVADCSGNLINPAKNTFAFYLPEISDSLDILLNEVLFAPRSGGEKFVELYNHSDKHINLKNWQLANMVDDTVSNYKLITADDFILAPGKFLVLTEDATILKADYPQTKSDRVLEMTALPSYPVTEGTVVLVNERQEAVQIFEYADDFHFSLLKEDKGVSLERISWEERVDDPENWHSAASSAGYATPGFMNSQYRHYGNISAQFEISPKVFLPDNSGQADFTSIRYQFEESGHVASIRIFDARGRAVKDLVQNATLSTTGSLQWDGTDDHYQKVKMGYYLIYIELFHANGTKQVFKEKVVVAERF